MELQFSYMEKIVTSKYYNTLYQSVLLLLIVDIFYLKKKLYLKYVATSCFDLYMINLIQTKYIVVIVSFIIRILMQ